MGEPLVVPVEAGATYQVDSEFRVALGQPLYYQPDGSMGAREWLVKDIKARRVAWTGGLWWRGRPAAVSTVLQPAAYVMGGPEQDRPFESMLLVDDRCHLSEGWRWRWATRADAERGHKVMVALVRARRGHLRRIHSAYRRRRRWW